MSGVFWNILAALGGGGCSQTTLTRFWLFWTTYRCTYPLSFVNIFYLMNFDKKVDIFGPPASSSCKRSLWTAPYPKIRHIFFFVKLQWASSRFSHLTFFFHISENLCWVMILADIEDDQANNFEMIGSNHLLSASLINNKLELVPKTLGSSYFSTQSLCWCQTDPLWLKNMQKLFQVRMALNWLKFNDFSTSRLQ